MENYSVDAVLTILKHIPPFVWGILAYLFYVGIQALKPRMVSVNRLIFLPAALIALKYKIFISADSWVYVLALLGGIAIGYFKVRNSKIQIFRETRSILIPGSSSLIVILISMFLIKYYFGYLQAVDPAAYARDLLWDFAVSGLLSGYFTGQRVSYLYRYFAAA